MGTGAAEGPVQGMACSPHASPHPRPLWVIQQPDLASSTGPEAHRALLPGTSGRPAGPDCCLRRWEPAPHGDHAFEATVNWILQHPLLPGPSLLNWGREAQRGTDAHHREGKVRPAVSLCKVISAEPGPTHCLPGRLPECLDLSQAERGELSSLLSFSFPEG